MKRFQFLLLDAGPVIKLCELGIWDEFLRRCDVTICRTVAEEAKWASREFDDVLIDLESCEEGAPIRVVDVEVSVAKAFLDKFNLSYKAILHDGEKETLAFLDNNASEGWLVCAADKAVFKALGFLGKAERAVSLERVLAQIGLGRELEWRFTERFRQKYTALGQTDAIQEGGPS